MSARTTNRALVRRLRCVLPPTMEWDEADLVLLQLAERQAADLDVLEARTDLPAIRERRNARLALCRLVGQLDLPTHTKASVLRARKAAEGRWRAAS